MASPVEVYWNFALTADRDAQRVLPVEVGQWCMVYQTGHIHQAIAAGAGSASNWSIASSEAVESSDDVGNDSGVSGTSVTDALDQLDSDIGDLQALSTKNNASASAPAVTDDSDAGYRVTSLWVKSTGEMYMCVDATVGAAVWTQLDPKD